MLIQFASILRSIIEQHKWNNNTPAVLFTYMSNRNTVFLKDNKKPLLAVQSVQYQIILLFLSPDSSFSIDENVLMFGRQDVNTLWMLFKELPFLGFKLFEKLD